jgi:APA family basic amino acid/polyamine antiporter
MPSQEANLKKVLVLTDVLGFCFGNIIGAGVLVLTGVAIGLTGKGVVLAFLIAGVITCFTILPMAQLTSAIPTTGASYRYASLLLGPKWGFLWEIGIIFSKVVLAVYALAFAQYLQGVYPSIPVKTAAILMLTFFYVLNLVGIKTAAVTGKWLVVIKITGLAVFGIWGISAVNFSSFASMEALVPKGMDGLLQAVGLVAWASYGAVFVAELGGEMKNPARDIPIGLFVGTLGSTLFYIFIAFVAAGTLPIGQIADKPLSIVAKSILPAPVFMYFMIAGVTVALGTILNSVFQYITKGMIIACQDGWLPTGLGAVNKRFGTPHYCLTFFYVLGVVTIIGGISLANIARIGFGFMLAVNIIPVIACAYLPKKFPEYYEKALFRIKPKLLYPIIWISVINLIGQIFYVFKGLPTNLLITLVIIMAAAIAYVNIVGRRMDLKKISQSGFGVSSKAASNAK